MKQFLSNIIMKKLTFEEVMNRYEDLVNDEYEFPSFSSYYSFKETPSFRVERN